MRSSLSKRIVVIAVSSSCFLAATVHARCGDSNTALRPQSGRTARIKILVFNYSSASGSTLAEAAHEAARILSKAGVEAEWVECPTLGAEANRTCADIANWDIRLHILNHAQGNSLSDGVLGFAVAPARANVFYDYARRIAHEDGTDYEAPILLGSVIVHEIGHLLLDPDAHSTSGIMQPNWRREQLNQMMEERLVFTPAQAKIIRAQVAIRLQLQTAALTRLPNCRLLLPHPDYRRVARHSLVPQEQFYGIAAALCGCR